MGITPVFSFVNHAEAVTSWTPAVDPGGSLERLGHRRVDRRWTSSAPPPDPVIIVGEWAEPVPVSVVALYGTNLASGDAVTLRFEVSAGAPFHPTGIVWDTGTHSAIPTYQAAPAVPYPEWLPSFRWLGRFDGNGRPEAVMAQSFRLTLAGVLAAGFYQVELLWIGELWTPEDSRMGASQEVELQDLSSVAQLDGGGLRGEDTGRQMATSLSFPLVRGSDAVCWRNAASSLGRLHPFLWVKSPGAVPFDPWTAGGIGTITRDLRVGSVRRSIQAGTARDLFEVRKVGIQAWR